MNFVDRASADPLGAFCACFVWIPIAVWIVSMIHWMVSGDVDTLFGAMAIGVAIALGVATVNPPTPRLSPFILLTIVLTVVLFPYVRMAINQRAFVALDLEQLEKYHDALRFRPDNVAALIKFAEIMYVRGYPASAIGLGERALKSMPENLFRHEHQMVNVWKMQTSGRRLSTTVSCVECGHPNSTSDLHCVKCGKPHVLMMAKGRGASTGLGLKLIGVWVGVVVAFLGIPYAAQLAPVSQPLAVGLIVAQAVVCLLVVYRVFLRESDG